MSALRSLPDDDINLKDISEVKLAYCERCEKSVAGIGDKGDLLCPHCSLLL